MKDHDVEERIHDFFLDNYEMLKLEGGHSMTAESRQIALQQVLLYWKKLKDVALHVTDTEVKLNLPGQTTPAGRTFGIEGVVDIVREDDRTVMYDIKTHAPEQVRGNRELYAQQLNVYAHIWQRLRGQALDEQKVICTQVPWQLRQAIADSKLSAIEHWLAEWQPYVDIPADENSVEETIRQFGAVVDRIESGQFAPRDVETLRASAPGGRLAFARDVCRNCDARFSCSAYRAYIRTATRTGAFEKQFAQYLEDYGDEEDLILRRAEAALDPE